MQAITEHLQHSRLLLGTARYPSFDSLKESIKRSGTKTVTLSLRRQVGGSGSQMHQPGFLQMLRSFDVSLLPNTAGCRSVKEAITIAQMARELLGTSWIKLEICREDRWLTPDVAKLTEAAAILCKEGFEVFPYTDTSVSVAEKLFDVGCKIVMPWASPIGSGRGLEYREELGILRQHFPKAVLIVDAGIGAPSHAAGAMEMGFDGVLLNTAVSAAFDPPSMAEAFALAVQAGRLAFESGLMRPRDGAVASSPTVGVPFSELESWSSRGHE